MHGYRRTAPTTTIRTIAGWAVVTLLLALVTTIQGASASNAEASAPGRTAASAVERAPASDLFAAGWSHQCAIDAGDLRCWGGNTHGQLGYGDTIDRSDPGQVDVVDIGGKAVAVSAGQWHTCAVRDDGAVLCWGLGLDGRLGYGTGTDTIGDDETPAAVGAIDLGRAAINVTAGYRHTCATLDNGRIRCWGSNENGRLGNLASEAIGDDETPASMPPVEIGDQAIDVDAGDRITCAVLANGLVRCWGMTFFNIGFISACDDDPDQTWHGDFCTMGIGDDEHPVSVDTIPIPQPDSGPARVGGRRAVAVSVGNVHACALLDDGRVACWGRGWHGQLGNGARENVDPHEGGATVVLLDVNATSVSAGHEYTCASLSNGVSRCWGSAHNGGAHLGNGATSDVFLPQSVPAVAALVTKSVAVAVGGHRSCSRGVGGETTCWGTGASGTSTLVTDTHVTQVTAGDDHTCALSSDGSVRCWGRNDAGQLGLGHTQTIGDDEAAAAPPAVQLGGVAKMISAGDDHTCAVMGNGDVRCWGAGADGRLGYGNTDAIGDDEHPAQAGVVKLGATGRAVSVAAGGPHTCAVLDNGDVRCWGRAAEGQLGYGNTTPVGSGPSYLPKDAGSVPLGGHHRARVLTAGHQHTCAVLSNGRAQCWGRGDDGRLGYGSQAWIGDNETLSTKATIQLGSDREVISISAGFAHTCAILDNGYVRCFGDGQGGRLGYGNQNDIGDNEHPSTQDPVSFEGEHRARALEVGSFHSCVITGGARARCWGAGAFGKLGLLGTGSVGGYQLPSVMLPIQVPGDTVSGIAVGGDHTCAIVLSTELSCWGSNQYGALGYGRLGNVGDDEHPVGAGLVPFREDHLVTVTGTVTGHDGSPVDGVEVTMYAADASGAYQATGEPATTGTNGQFEIGRLLAGDYTACYDPSDNLHLPRCWSGTTTPSTPFTVGSEGFDASLELPLLVADDGRSAFDLAIAGYEVIIGSYGDDVIDLQSANGPVAYFGLAGADQVTGSAFADLIHGGGGNDVLWGMAGDDEIVAHGGADQLLGGDGADLLRGGDGNDAVHGQDGDDQMHGDNGNDALYGGAGDDGIFGGYGDDLLIGGEGSDVLDGGPGNDHIDGLYYD